jgi:hypothetical protein
VLPHDIGQLVLGLPPKLFAPCDCRRVEPNAPWLGEDPFVVIADEGGRCLEAVRATVGVENVPVKGGPLQLFGAKTLANALWRTESDCNDPRSYLPQGCSPPVCLVSSRMPWQQLRWL